MKKTLRRLTVFAVIVVMALCGFMLGGCAPTKIVNARGDYGDYQPLQLVMNAGETYTVNANHFRDLGIEFYKFELKIPTTNTMIDNVVVEKPDNNFVSVSGDTITAQHNGFAEVGAYLYEKKTYNGSKTIYAWYILVAEIHVINIAEMTEIKTAQELQDINLDLDGNYILKSNIDLAGFDWKPIVGKVMTGPNYNGISFRGSFINPDGFVIQNLTSDCGLFGFTYRAYIDGIILENVNIDGMSDYIDVNDVVYFSRLGGIVGYARDTIIFNCKVEGSIKALHNAGGIVGYCYGSAIKNCEFTGTIEANFKIILFNTWTSAGGIVGELDVFLQDSLPVYSVGIFDCKVNAEITSKDFAGGIVGYNYGNLILNDCIFVGTVQGKMGQGELCGYSRY